MHAGPFRVAAPHRIDILMREKCTVSEIHEELVILARRAAFAAAGELLVRSETALPASEDIEVGDRNVGADA